MHHRHLTQLLHGSCLLLLLLNPPPLRAEVPLDAAGQAVSRLLADPTTRAVVVDFYGTWCGPCQAAIGELAELQRVYGPRGLRLVVVTVESEGAITRPDHRGPAWKPQAVVRDDDRALMARWQVRDLPTSFLFTWQQGLTPVGQRTGAGSGPAIARQAEAFFLEALKILVDAPVGCQDRPLAGGEGKNLQLSVQALLLGQSRFDVVVDDATLQGNIKTLVRQAREVKREAESCPVDQMVPANNRLLVRHCGGKLWLELLPLGLGCRAALVEADVHQGLSVAAAPLAVQKLMAQLGLAGLPATLAAASSPPVVRPDPAPGVKPLLPEVVSTEPVISSGAARPVVGNLAVEVKPYDQVRLELTDPTGQRIVNGSPYRNPQAAVGAWKVAAAATGHEPEERSFTVPPDETTAVKFDLVRLGGLTLTGTEGAAVAVTGPGGFSRTGALPWNAQGLRRGSYRVAVSRTGYTPITRDVEVQPGQTAKAELVLEKIGAGQAGSWGIVWKSLPGGSFRMGSAQGGDGDERPVRQVTLSPFQLMETELTVAMYRQCVQAGKCSDSGVSGGETCNYDKSDRTAHPMNCLNWTQADAFCRAVGGRLPTEAEWEYAARSGGKEQKYPWGDRDASCELAIMGHADACTTEKPCGCGRNLTWPVCSKKAGNSAQGLCDLAGNVWEWVADWYEQYPARDETDPTGPAGGSLRVYRGGSWSSPASNLRAADRGRGVPANRYGDLGARCARSVHP